MKLATSRLLTNSCRARTLFCTQPTKIVPSSTASSTGLLHALQRSVATTDEEHQAELHVKAFTLFNLLALARPLVVEGEPMTMFNELQQKNATRASDGIDAQESTTNIRTRLKAWRMMPYGTVLPGAVKRSKLQHTWIGSNNFTNRSDASIHASKWSLPRKTG